jgi:L-asparaginase
LAGDGSALAFDPLRAQRLTAPVRVGRGYPEGFANADHESVTIAGMNLTATKARLLLMACLMKFGSLPAAADPARPAPGEIASLKAAVAEYQKVFDTH